MRKLILSTAALLMLGAVLLSAWLAYQSQAHAQAWTPAELATLRSLSLSALPPLPPDPSNAVADDPHAAALGRQIFFDPRFSGNQQVSCATCHIPGRYFTDGKALGQGMGIFTRHTMSLVGAAYSPWLTWDGKADSLWAQALGPLENTAEHGGDRLAYARTLAAHYADEYTPLFGPLPDFAAGRLPIAASPLGNSRTRAAWAALDPADQAAITQAAVNMGKALAAYQRTILPQPARFDRYVAALGDDGRPASPGAATNTPAPDAPAGGSPLAPSPLAGPAAANLSADEIAGLRLFIGKAQCLNCHNGPLFTNFEFHNTAVPNPPGLPLDYGRRGGVELLSASEFTCLGPYSDVAAPEQCGEIRFLKTGGDTFDGSFRTPTLRNVAATAPYMHAGQFATLQETLAHYNNGGGYTLLGHNELTPLNLSEAEINQLDAFLQTLTAPVPTVP